MTVVRRIDGRQGPALIQLVFSEVSESVEMYASCRTTIQGPTWQRHIFESNSGIAIDVKGNGRTLETSVNKLVPIVQRNIDVDSFVIGPLR